LYRWPVGKKAPAWEGGRYKGKSTEPLAFLDAVGRIDLVGEQYSQGPSAPWPARQSAARKRKPATPVGMTE